MATKPLDDALLQEALNLDATHGSSFEAAQHAHRQDGQLGLNPATFRSRLAAARAALAEGRLQAPKSAAGAAAAPQDTRTPLQVRESLRALLLGGAKTLPDLVGRLQVAEATVKEHLNALDATGYNVRLHGQTYSLEKAIPLPMFRGSADLPTYYSRPDNTYLFGATSDNHLGSKYARLDVLNELYDRFAEAGVDRVFNAGNWIDGEARFNKFDLEVHGMDAQCRFLAENYPRREGIKTYAVAGDDHEGWYTQREGVNIGKYAERAMADAGRDDWVDLGYMEAFIRLVNSNTGVETILTCVHPGGGSAYALSYSIQKIIESLDGGEKPAVGLYGHYHKLWAGNIRNVWCLQTGCTEDQTPFMRKQKLEAHIGGALVHLEQDPRTGAITGFTPKLMRWFNKGYYNHRWSHSGPVALAERGV